MKYYTLKSIIITAYFIIYILFMSSCSSADKRLLVGLIAPSTDHLPVGLGLQEGFLDETDLKIHYFSSGWEVNEALISGRIDIAIMPFTYAWKGVSENKNIRIIGFFERESDGIIAVNGIDSIEELEGTKVGVLRASTIDIFLHLVADKYKFQPEIVYFRTPTEMAVALQSGAVKALSFYVPQIFRFSDEYSPIYWYSEDYPLHPCCDIVASQSALVDKRDIINSFITGLHHSCNFLNDNQDTGIELMMKNYHLDRREAELTLQKTSFIISLDEAGKEFQRLTAQKMKELGYLKRVPEFEEVYYEGVILNLLLIEANKVSDERSD